MSCDDILMKLQIFRSFWGPLGRRRLRNRDTQGRPYQRLGPSDQSSGSVCQQIVRSCNIVVSHGVGLK